jgi:hypothetical protein
MLLDTLDDMEAARGLYATLGFEEIPPYYFNPIAGAHYLKVDLDAPGTALVNRAPRGGQSSRCRRRRPVKIGHHRAGAMSLPPPPRTVRRRLRLALRPDLGGCIAGLWLTACRCCAAPSRPT